ncbi:ribonuclease H-like domain-containing protein [Russula brevipes]|nr:ribonuclease H-like domain-containing protein [Russula brevipes]
MSLFDGHIAFLFFAFSIPLAFLWYHSYKDSGTRSSHSTPQPPPSPDSESGHDMAPIVRQSTEHIASTNEQYRAVRVPQPYDAFLVLDVEATCLPGTDFHWPNEIIEWPVCLLMWVDKEANGMAGTLQKVAEFRSFVKPTWRPRLSPFCISLTGITQDQVDDAPHFPEVANKFSAFLAHHGLIHPVTGERLLRFSWCSDGPFDIRDFVVKQCFISNIPMPSWIRGDVIDVRKVVVSELNGAHTSKNQLLFLDLGPFEGRQHSGIDAHACFRPFRTRLARRGVRLIPNTQSYLDDDGGGWADLGRFLSSTARCQGH